MDQSEYIAILFSDCGVDTPEKRKAWLDLRGYRADIDGLTIAVRANIINALRVRRTELQNEQRTPCDMFFQAERQCFGVKRACSVCNSLYCEQHGKNGLCHGCICALVASLVTKGEAQWHKC